MTFGNNCFRIIPLIFDFCQFFLLSTGGYVSLKTGLLLFLVNQKASVLNVFSSNVSWL